ncbi:glycosyltransferase family 4 protein [Ramlibacter sp.]|uniref:glycosyltransferase family 4 protein n=1 Tax=Ramlibacter sp. TaxID=1917967 RepID=UPI002D371E01|nr:glycosyltransferase family 4 protein [Ramlibacter sp.]HYD75503.1 glycosyltransferase family 4 protein [Ramlibacter sp.]
MAGPEIAGRPARIAIVRGAWNAAGGAERFVQRIAGALAARGIEVTLIARRWAGQSEAGLPPATRLIETGLGHHFGRVGRDAAFAREVLRVVAQERFDLVQSHERIPGLAIYRAGDGVHREWLAQRRRKHGGLRQALGDRFFGGHAVVLRTEQAMYRHPDLRCVICNSEMVRNEIVRHYGVDPRQLAVIRNGVDLQRFRPPSPAEREQARTALGWPQGQPVLLFVGSGFDRKGVDVALQAFAAAGLGRSALFAVVGRDRHQPRYERLAQRLGIAPAVQFHGPQPDVLRWYHGADALVLPTLYDPQSNAVLEAMACGLPVVTSTGCGAAEVLPPDAGAVVDALDTAALAAALQQVLADPAQARAMGQRARQAIEPYGLSRMTDDYLALYNRLLAAPHEPAA